MPGKGPVFAVLAVFIGVLMIGWWTFAIASDQIPELKTEPVEVYLHLTAEFSTAACLLIGGIGILGRRNWGPIVYTFALGMLLYAVVQAAGYYAQRSEFVFVGMFGVLAFYALVGLWRALRQVK